MTREEYIKWVAPRIVLDSLNWNLLPSFRIAQALFEPDFGQSELAIKANNLFGVKVNDQWEGAAYNKVSGECYNGKDYEKKASDFQAYDSWDESIYWQGWYLANRCTTRKYHPELLHYAQLIGNRDYKDCARVLEEKDYGTAPDYDQRVIDYVEKYGLTKYDSMTREEALALVGKKEEEIMIGMVGVNAGHTAGGPGYGAVGLIKESEHTRKVAAALNRYLRAAGVQVKECTVDKAGTSNEYLSRVVYLANGEDLEWFISIHFNAGGGRGVEIYTYQGRQYQDAIEVCENIAALGFKNRGVKAGTGLYVIRKTKAKSMLIEVCFVDTEDANLYLQTGAVKIAQAIAAAFVPIAYPEVEAPAAPVQPKKQKYVRVKANELNVRNAPSWESRAICGTVRKREVFTVVDQIMVCKTMMYKLKSGLYITAHEHYVEVYEK